METVSLEQVLAELRALRVELEKQKSVNAAPELISLVQLIKLLSRSKASIERDIHLGNIPLPLRIGKARRWRLSEIRQWLDDGCPPVQIAKRRRYQ